MSEAAPGGRNEDLVVASNDWCVVLDGATEITGVDSGCQHGVRWYVSHLALSLASQLINNPTASLIDILKISIENVSSQHEDSCDLSNPDSPSSVVLILREKEEFIDYLGLGDSAIVLDTKDAGLQVILDNRTAHLRSHTIEAVRRLRNSEDGFWVASTTPGAATHALTGSVPKLIARRAVLLTDGAYRLVDRFGWALSDVLGLIENSGPISVIREVRQAEAHDKVGKGKKHDDATVAFIRF
jgi:hypothetical protein